MLSCAWVEHNFPHGFGMRGPEAAPPLVVPPPNARRSVASVEPNPPLHVRLAHPQALHATVLRQDDDIRHATHSTPRPKTE